MKTRIELNVIDIEKIIAEHFSVNIDNVTAVCKKQAVGYGKEEHKEYTPYALIEKSN